jgi:hypothetical protein
MYLLCAAVLRLQQVRPLALTLTLSGKNGALLAIPDVFASFPNCQRLRYICAAEGGNGSLQALHLAMRDALPYMNQVKTVELELDPASAW